MFSNSQLQSTHTDMRISQQFRMRFELGAKASNFCLDFPDQAELRLGVVCPAGVAL